MSADRKPASEVTALRNREARGCAAARAAPRTSPTPSAASSPASSRRGSRARAAGSSGTSSLLRLPREECPETAHPSLWRQSRLNRIAGLFEIAPGFYQLRGFDLSNMHVVEGEHGIVVIDPLISAETAAAALALYREHAASARSPASSTPTATSTTSAVPPGSSAAEEVAEREYPRAGTGRASSTTRSARTSTPGPRWAAAPATCTGRRCGAGPTAGSAPASARRPRWGR